MKQRNINSLYQCCTRGLALLCAGFLAMAQGMTVYGAPSKEERIAAHQAMPIQSNEVTDWPEGPIVSAESAILMEMNTGTILYAKNIHQHQYPASTTKILTTLIASERCSMDEIVTFSHDAVFDTPRDSNHIAMDVGDTLTMSTCLNAILIRSANEVSFAVAEHIAGTRESFADIMNQRAKELGCVDSNFVNPNGLPDENHYTSAYDLAMIGRAFFANDMLCQITTTPKLVVPKKKEDLIEWNQMQLLPGKEYAYEYLVGCKTGYTDAARSTLVSCAEKDGLKLICVVLNDESPYQYEDTIALFNYGFGNFDKINVSQTETKYHIDDAGFFYNDNDIFGNSQPILSLNKDDYIILPKTATIADTVSTISYETENENQAAIISYTYQDVPIGTASVNLVSTPKESYSFNSTSGSANDTAPKQTTQENASFLFINIKKMIFVAIGIVAVLIIIIIGKAILRNYQFSERSTRHSLRRERGRRTSRFTNRHNNMHSRRKAEIREARRRSRKRKHNKFRDYDF